MPSLTSTQDSSRPGQIRQTAEKPSISRRHRTLAKSLSTQTRWSSPLSSLTPAMPLTDPDAARGTPASPGLFGLLGIYALRAAAWLSIGLPRQGEPDAFRQGDHQAPMATQNIQTVTGTVEQTNDNGFKLNNSNWVNYSQYGYHGPKY